MMRHIFAAATLFTLLSTSANVRAQSTLSPYTQQLMESIEATGYAATTVDDGGGLSLKAKSLRLTDGQLYISAFIHVDETTDIAAIEALGVRINTRAGSILTAQIPATAMQALSAVEGIRYIDAAMPVRPMMDIARAACNVDYVHEGTDLDASYNGDGVVVGIIDMGFQYDHINFYDLNQSTLRIQRVWEQDWDSGTPPDGYSYGGEMTTSDEMLSYKGDVTTTSHGTHVTGIAAGADTYDGNTYYGVAPGADIVLVSMGGDTDNNVNLSDAIAYIYDYAESVGKPCVVNMSIGSQIGPHDGTSSFDQLCDALQGEGKLLVGAIGNYGATKCHVAGAFTSADDAPVQTLVSFLDDVDDGGEIDVWGDEGMDLTVQVFIFDTYSGTKKDSIEVDASAATGSTKKYSFQSNCTGSVTITTEINPLNNKPHAYIAFDITRFKSKSCAGLSLKPRSAGTAHAWSDADYIVFTDSDFDEMTDGDTDYTVAEVGGTGNTIISVGAYTTRDYLWTESNSTHVDLGETLGEVASYSGRGPTVDGRVKPFITAPGGAIVSSLSNNDANLDDQYIVRTITYRDTNYYGLMQGTSMSAPFVTGVLATWLQANPELTPDAAKDIIQATAITNDYTGEISSEGDNGWGYGIIDAWAGIKQCIATSSIGAISDGTAGTSLLMDGANNCRLLFAGATNGVRADIVSVDGRLVRSTDIGNVSTAEEVSIDTSALPRGVYLLHVTANGLNKTYKLRIND